MRGRSFTVLESKGVGNYSYLDCRARRGGGRCPICAMMRNVTADLIMRSAAPSRRCGCSSRICCLLLRAQHILAFYNFRRVIGDAVSKIDV